MSKYRYLNLNPKNRKTGDCVIRAIAGALDLTWDEASDLLYEVARAVGCEMSCLGCYTQLFDLLNLEEIEVPEGFTVGELVDEYPNNILLIRIKGHLTFSLFRCVYDIWDCRGEIVDRAWIVG